MSSSLALIYYRNDAFHAHWGVCLSNYDRVSTYIGTAVEVLTRICERMAYKFRNFVFSVFMGMIVPSIIAVVLTYAVHMLKGTPEPLNSTIPTMILAPMGFVIWGSRRRRQRDKAVKIVNPDMSHEASATG